MPYLPIVNAMAPKAPIGATFMIEEKDVGSFFNKFVDWVTGAAQELEGKAENDREEQDLENVALRKGPDNGGGNDMKQKVQSRLRLFGCCIHRDGIHI